MIPETLEKDRAHSKSLGLLEDRVVLRHGRCQIYGSQIERDFEAGEYSVSPLEDAKHLDELRAEVFLQLMVKYVRSEGPVWDAETCATQLSVLEERLKS